MLYGVFWGPLVRGYWDSMPLARLVSRNIIALLLMSLNSILEMTRKPKYNITLAVMVCARAESTKLQKPRTSGTEWSAVWGGECGAGSACQRHATAKK